jgi:5-methylcytosine-specific restriction endonuclease McrA
MDTNEQELTIPWCQSGPAREWCLALAGSTLTAKIANGTVAQFTRKSAKGGHYAVYCKQLHTSLNSQVLVLNRLWQAVNICSARRAFALVYAGHAQIVESDDANNFLTHDFESWRDLSANAPDHEVVTTISFKIRIPRVIVLLVFDRLPKKEVKFTRHNVFERDKNTCQYCGELFDRNELNLDHVVPRDQGGTTTWENVVCSCIACNTRKGNRLPREAHMSLIRKPKRPKWRPFVQITFSAPQHDLWKHFVDLAYWNVELSD